MRVDKVIITFGRMRVIAAFEDGERRYTDSEMAAKALEAYPTLGIHSCINSKGPTFAAVMGQTSIAHLIEHLMIAEQSAMAAEKGVEDVTFVGNTHWIDEGRGLAEIQVSFIDDLDAAKALANALKAVSSFFQ